MEQGLTEIVLIVDRSGSMSGLEDDTVGGINALLDRNRSVEGEALVTTVLFDNELLTLHDRLDLREVKPLTRADYQPRGMTALLDAVGETVASVARTQRILPPDWRPEHTVVAIATDGHENASKRFTYPQVKELIEEKTAQGWEFLFLGANIDAAAEASRIGIAPARAASFVCDEQGSGLAYEAFADAIESVRCDCGVPEGWAAPCTADAAARATQRR